MVRHLQLHGLMSLGLEKLKLNLFAPSMFLTSVFLFAPTAMSETQTVQAKSCQEVLKGKQAKLSEDEAKGFARIASHIWSPGLAPDQLNDNLNILSLLRPTLSTSQNTLSASGHATDSYYFFSAGLSGHESKSTTRQATVRWEFNTPSDESFGSIFKELFSLDVWKGASAETKSNAKSFIKDRFKQGVFVANLFSALPGNEPLSNQFFKLLLMQLAKSNRDESYERYIDDVFGISFYAQSQGEFASANVQYWVVFKNRSTAELSRKMRTEVTYEAQFFPPRNLAKVGVSYGAFKLYANGKPLDIDLPLVNREYSEFTDSRILREGITSLALKTTFNHAPEGAREQILLKVSSVLNFESIIASMPSPFAKDKEGNYILASMFASHYANFRTFDGKLYTLKEQNLFFNELERAYNNRSSHLMAAEVYQREGINGVISRLAQYGYTLGKPLEDQVDILAAITQEVATGRIPFEIGDFAKKHGAHSHHVQFLGILQSLSPPSQKIFLEMNRRIGNVSQQPFWSVWNILFDATSGKANDPTYWRDLVES